MSYFIRLLGGKKAALVLMAVIAALAVLGSIIPQAHITPAENYSAWQAASPYAALFEQLGLTRIFFTWYFYLPVLLFAVNLSLCTWQQVSRLRTSRLPALERAAEAVTKLRNRTEIPHQVTVDAALSSAADVLRKSGFRKHAANSHTLLAVKGVPGGYGMVLFHASLLLIVLGAAVTGLSRFNGYVMIGEGQYYDGRPEMLLYTQRAPLYRNENIPFALRVDSIATEYNKDGILRDFSTNVSYADGNRQHAITYNSPLAHRGYTFHQDKLGYAPRLLITSPEGETLYNGFLIVDTIKDPQGDIYRGGAHLGNLSLAMEFYPDHIEYQGEHYTRSSRPANPLLLLSITSGEEELFFGPLPLGKAADAGGYTVSFEELRRWTGFLVVYDRGYSLLFAGFFLALIALLLYYLFPLQYIFVYCSNGSVKLAGRGLRFPAAFAVTFTSLQEELAHKLNSGEDVK